MNEISFSYEKMSTKTRFEEEAKGNSEMAYYSYVSSSWGISPFFPKTGLGVSPGASPIFSLRGGGEGAAGSMA